MTNGEFVSEIANILKSINKDDRISRRLILKIGQDVAEYLISQKWGDRSILAETSLYSHIPCFEFERIETKSCPSIEFRLCNILMKSKKPLPKLIFSRLGSSIKEVVSLDGEFTFTYIDETQYRRNKKRQHKLKNEVCLYLGSDNHLYIPDKEIFSLDLTVLSTDTTNIENCSGCLEKDKCKSYYDYEFIAPSKLIEAIKDMTLSRLGVTLQVKSDQNPNSIQGA